MSVPINPKVKDIVDKYMDLTTSLNRNLTHFMRYMTGDSLTPEQLTTMFFIKKLGSCTSTQLANEFGVKKSAITSITNRLVEKNLVSRMGDPQDRRNIYLSLTEEGNAICEEMDSKIHTFITPIIMEFKEEEVSTFLANLEKLDTLVGNITKK